MSHHIQKTEESKHYLGNQAYMMGEMKHHIHLDIPIHMQFSTKQTWIQWIEGIQIHPLLHPPLTILTVQITIIKITINTQC
jgi:hypothetical protein